MTATVPQFAPGSISGAPVAQSEEQRTFNPRVRRSKLRGGTTPSLDRLPANMRAKIQIELCPVPELPGFCWGWTGAIQSRGYGSFQYDKRRQSTHRLAYELLTGPIPAGLEIDHLCRNRRCCNPAHLEPVTRKVNAERAITSRKDCCVNGHALVGHNLVIKKRGAGRTTSRNCRQCALDAARRYRRRLAVAS